MIALDIHREAYEIGTPLIVKAGVTHKVDFRDGPAMDGIDMLLKYVSWSFSIPVFASIGSALLDGRDNVMHAVQKRVKVWCPYM